MEFAEFQAALIAAEKRIKMLERVLSKLDEDAADEIHFIEDELNAARADQRRISSLLEGNTLDRLNNSCSTTEWTEL